MFQIADDQMKAMARDLAGEPAVSPCPMASLTQSDIDLAAQPGNSPEHRRAREAVAGYYYLSTPGLLHPNVPDTKQNRQAKFRQDLKGIDLSQPLEIIEMPPPATMDQHKRKSKGNATFPDDQEADEGQRGGLGQFFDPKGGQEGTAMGVNDDSQLREPVTCVIPEIDPKIRGLRSTASPIVDDWTDIDPWSHKPRPVACRGGGEQVNVPFAALEKITWKPKPEKP